ncbi:MAG: tRNA uridine-5-carboxymethylaminomethyl(34) synthesis GTPase MnmE [Bacteroidota bacterium]
MYFKNQDDTICALSTAPGMAAIALIRLSGKESVEIVGKSFSKEIDNARGYSLHYGSISENEDIIDDVVVAVYRNPKSFTGEDVVEISCHGSQYIQSRLLKLYTSSGCRLAEPGEFSMRAFANGKMDLSQAEAVADLISSSTEASHKLAMNQMRGNFSRKINVLRDQLIHFASMIELELDFSEEDVEFANRDDLKALINSIQMIVVDLMESFATGNAIKNGVPVAILGAPNMGKSTLLNALLDDDRAIVSEIAGTTRDTIEDETTIGGVRFRFIDTAGIRETEDKIESIGIGRAFEKAEKASIVLYLFDAVETKIEELEKSLEELKERIGETQEVIAVANKADKAQEASILEEKFENLPDTQIISATDGIGLETLREKLLKSSNSIMVEGHDIVVTNVRHYNALSETRASLDAVLEGLDNGITGDFLAIDIRRALHHLGEITGEITTDDLLGNIFSKFCIGK